MNKCDICMAIGRFFEKQLPKIITSDVLIKLLERDLDNGMGSVLQVPVKVGIQEMIRIAKFYYDPRDICEVNHFCPRENNKQRRSATLSDQASITSTVCKVFAKYTQKISILLKLITGKDCDLQPPEQKQECYDVVESINDKMKQPSWSLRKLHDTCNSYGFPFHSRARSLIGKASLVRKSIFVYRCFAWLTLRLYYKYF